MQQPSSEGASHGTGVRRGGVEYLQDFLASRKNDLQHEVFLLESR